MVFSHHCDGRETIDQGAIAAEEPDYLFSFGPTIVRQRLLRAVKVAAINFHTGPPAWPGRGSVSFALYEGDAEFGVTAHIITDEIDQGPIVRVMRFAIDPSDDVVSLDARTKEAIPKLAAAVLDDLDTVGVMPIAGERWERKTKRYEDLLSLMRVTPDEDLESIRRKIRAFAHPTKPGPYVEIAGERFWYRVGA